MSITLSKVCHLFVKMVNFVFDGIVGIIKIYFYLFFTAFVALIGLFIIFLLARTAFMIMGAIL